MRLCSDDPLLQIVFDKLHAHPIRVPESRIAPFGVFIRLANDEVSWIGALQEIVAPEVVERLKALEPLKSSQLADITAQRSSSFAIDDSLEVLGGFLAAFGATACLPAVRLQFKRFRRASFMFTDALREGYSPASVGRALPADVNSFDLANPVVTTWLERSARPTAYIIDSVICSNHFVVQLSDGISVDAKIDHAPINALLDASAKLSAVRVMDTEIGFVGKTDDRLPFAITCLRVTVTKDKKKFALEPYLADQAFLRGPNETAEFTHDLLSSSPTLLEWR